MNIAIIEDNRKDKKKIENLLKQFQKENEIVMSVDSYSTGEEFLEFGSCKNFHLLFMDIYMEKLDGIETAIQLQRIRDDGLIVFLTSSEEDIWRAVKTHGCFDYVCKSELDFGRLEKLIKDVMHKLSISEKKIEFQSGTKKNILKLQDIQYILSQDKYILIIFKNNLERRYRYPFSKLYDLIKDNSCFLLCNRGVLLNINSIYKTDGVCFLMKNGVQFPIRRIDRKVILQRFNDYQFELLDTQGVLQ